MIFAVKMVLIVFEGSIIESKKVENSVYKKKLNREVLKQ